MNDASPGHAPRTVFGIPASIFYVLAPLMALSAFTINIGLPVIPPMVEALGASPSAGQAAVTAYLAGFACGQIPIGVAADRWGRRRVTLAALAGFLGASVLVATAGDIEALLAARFAQGVFGACGAVLARAVARDLAKDGDASELLSVLMSILAVAPVLAPLVGAWLFSVGEWRAPFWAIVIYGAALAAAVTLVLPETGAREIAPPDPVAIIPRALASPQYLHGALMIALPHTGYLAFLTASSSILARDYGIGPTGFAWLFALATAALCSGGMSARIAIRTLGARAASSAGVCCVGVSAVGLAALSVLDLPPLPLYWICVIVFIFGHGVAAPIFSAAALKSMGDIAGAASALMGTLQIFAGFLGSLVAAQFLQGAPGLALVMAVPALIGCVLHIVHVRRGEI